MKGVRDLLKKRREMVSKGLGAPGQGKDVKDVLGSAQLISKYTKFYLKIKNVCVFTAFRAKNKDRP